MRLFGLIVTKNEANRYLRDSLLWHYWMFDGIAVYDDQSDDATASIATEYGAKVKIRPDDAFSFLQHEGQFRYDAFKWFWEAFNPNDDDWVLALDADEFFIGGATALYDAAISANAGGHASVQVELPEVFALDDDGTPLVRVDGYWPGQSSPRFFRWLPTAEYKDKAMASGSVPTYAEHNPMPSDLQMLHYGYAKPEDRNTKFNRYAMFKGHNPSHVRSILQKPKLERWTKKVPILR